LLPARASGYANEAAARPDRAARLSFIRVKGNGMSIVGTLIIGLLAGLVARFLMPGRDAAGFIVTIVLGVAGAFLATWLGQRLGWYREGQTAGFIGAVVGALIILVVYRLIVGRRAAS
jgi:uncharacterized membrane protein YeaQ/YmgE (transglycosylase-associated protein family)